MKILKIKSNYLFAVMIMLFTSFANADGFETAKSLLEEFSGALLGLSIATVTIAVGWVGYKILFGGNTLRECAPIIIGAIIIAGAPEVAKLLVG